MLATSLNSVSGNWWKLPNITLDSNCLLCDLRKNLAVVEASEFTSSWPSAIAALISVLIILQKTCWTSIKRHVRRQYLCDGWHHASKEASSQSDCLQETSWLLTKTHFISNMLTTCIGPLQPSQLSVLHCYPWARKGWKVDQQFLYPKTLLAATMIYAKKHESCASRLQLSGKESLSREFNETIQNLPLVPRKPHIETCANNITVASH